MSLILEALRKSEAERRRAQVPDLLTEPQVATPPVLRAPQRWPWMAGGGVLLIAMAWFALTRDGTPPSASDVAASVDADVPAAQALAEDTPTSAAPAPTRPAPALRRPLVVAPPAPPAPAQPTATTVALRAPADDPRPAMPNIAPPPADTRATAFASPPRVPVANASAGPAYERVTDLGNEDRKQLPPLKLTMHMWNDVVAQRFVIIDGSRLSVGDRLGAVVVADIVPDGVVLDWNGRPLKLPLR
jgi:general secretion pathway protein B